MSGMIIISNLQVPVVLGVPAEERALAQVVEISVQMSPMVSLFGLNDEIDETINYYDVSQDILKVSAQRERKLIETLNEDLIRFLMDKYPISEVTIRTDKFILPNTKSVSIEMSSKEIN